MPKETTRAERRDTSPAGAAGRNQFEESFKLLTLLGLSAQALDYYRRRANEARRLPHEVVRDVAEQASQRPGGNAPGYTVPR
jgi:hypothetical protein